MAPAHVGVTPSLRRVVAKMPPPIDHLLRRASADPELQPPTGDEVGCSRILYHVEWILVAHVDNGGADLDAPCPRAHRRQQREWRRELAREMVNPEVRAVRAKRLRGNGEIDGLQQRVCSRPRLRL